MKKLAVLLLILSLQAQAKWYNPFTWFKDEPSTVIEQTASQTNIAEQNVNSSISNATTVQQ
jgi:hypothetical protein